MHQQANAFTNTNTPAPHLSMTAAAATSPNTSPLPYYYQEDLLVMPPMISAPDALQGSLTQDLSTSAAKVNVKRREDPDRIRLDFLELWCYKLIASKSLSEAKTAEREMTQAMEGFDKCRDLGDFGRVHNRIQCAGLSQDVALLGHSSTQVGLEEHWNMIGEQLILLKSKLLRQDADTDVKEHLNATPDLHREQSSLFQAKYRRVNTLIKVQHSLCLFQKRLTHLTNNNSNNNSTESKRLVRQAIEEYETAIHKLFPTQTTSPAEDSDSVSVASNVRELPQALAGFLLRDLYQTSSANKNKNRGMDSPASSSSDTNHNKSSTALAERLLKHVQSVLQGKGDYSQSTCQTALRNLLLQWHDQVLEQPYLLQLGYGCSTGNSASFREEDAMLRRLSNAGNGTDAGIQHIDVSDHEQEEEEETEEEEPPAKKRKATFVPIQWVDSDDDSQFLFQPPPLDELSDDDGPFTAAKAASHNPNPNKSKPNMYTHRATHTLDSDSDDTQAQHAANARAEALNKNYCNRKRSRTDTDTNTNTTAPTDDTRIRVTPKEAQIIQQGVQKYGLGRWRIIQVGSNGALDKLTPQKIKMAYEQMKQTNNKRRK